MNNKSLNDIKDSPQYKQVRRELIKRNLYNSEAVRKNFIYIVKQLFLASKHKKTPILKLDTNTVMNCINTYYSHELNFASKKPLRANIIIKEADEVVMITKKLYGI